MSTYKIYESLIFPLHKSIIDFLRESRKTNVKTELACALNMSIILAAACYIEGVLEERGKNLLGYYRVIYDRANSKISYETIGNKSDFDSINQMKSFYKRIEKDLIKKASACTGIDNYCSFYELLIGKPIKADSKVKPLLEPISVLFQMRNVIAHGRQIHAYEINADDEYDLFDEHFEGGYKRAEEFLLKKKLLTQKYIDEQNISLLFSDKIADYFCETVYEFADILEQFIISNIEISDKFLNMLEEYNKEHRTSLTILEFFHLLGCIE